MCAAAILVVRDPAPGSREVTFVIDPRPLGAGLRHLDVTITVGDRVAAALSGDWDRDRPRQPLRLVTPTPAGEVTITLDVVTTDGAHRIVHRARPGAGAVVDIVLGAAP